MRTFLTIMLLSVIAVSMLGMATPSVVAEPVIITFDHQPGVAEEQAVTNLGGVVRFTYRIVPAIAAEIPGPGIAQLRANRSVLRIEPDGRIFAYDAELDAAWGVKRIGAGDVHASGNRGTGVKVAVIDSGIDYTHPDLDDNYAGGYDFVNQDTDPIDDNGHGTHVAGTIGGEDDDEGVVGVAPQARLYAYKVLGPNGSGSWSSVIAALDQAYQDGIQVTNNSYGSSSDPGTAVQAAFDFTADQGMVHVAAAGNSGNPKGKSSNVGYPGRYGSTIAVGATDANDVRASFSSTGSEVDVMAPGVAINSTRLSGGYVEYSGTSMASPHVAGTAALVIAAGTADVRAQLIATAHDLGDSGFDTKYGYGLVDAAAAAGAGAAVTPPAQATTMTVDSITYGTSGGKQNDRNLLIGLHVIDDSQANVAGASVSIELYQDGASVATGTGTTDSNGSVTFILRNAPTGTYTTVVTDVSAAGFAWDGGYPLGNSFDKQASAAPALAWSSASARMSDVVYELRLMRQSSEPVRETRLLSNYPNPFNPETWFPYELSQADDVVIRVYDLRGQLVRQLNLGHRQAGRYLERGQAAYWDGRDLMGQRVASGLYFYQLQAGEFEATRRMLVLK